VRHRCLSRLPAARTAAARPRAHRHRATLPSLYGNVEYAMCCTEGPVFPAESLDWDRVE
jgi:hypothetical protein